MGKKDEGRKWKRLTKQKPEGLEVNLQLFQARKSEAFLVKLHQLRNLIWEITGLFSHMRFASSPSGFYFIENAHHGEDKKISNILGNKQFPEVLLLSWLGKMVYVWNM